ncbi:MAG: hypothetical protein S4CHLAM102_12400 [Chlamydiia bacterium]|nr:hypothetical protein [Chlamydiia bacterium]
MKNAIKLKINIDRVYPHSDFEESTAVQGKLSSKEHDNTISIEGNTKTIFGDYGKNLFANLKNNISPYKGEIILPSGEKISGKSIRLIHVSTEPNSPIMVSITPSVKLPEGTKSIKLNIPIEL